MDSPYVIYVPAGHDVSSLRPIVSLSESLSV